MIAITQERLNQLESEKEDLLGLIHEIVAHQRDGDITIKGPAFRTWQRAVQQAATKDNKGIPYR